MLVSNIFYVHSYLGKIPILTNIFQMGWNHQLDIFNLPMDPSWEKKPSFANLRGFEAPQSKDGAYTWWNRRKLFWWMTHVDGPRSLFQGRPLLVTSGGMPYMDVSKNRGAPKWTICNGNPLLRWMIWGYHYFWKPPYMANITVGDFRVKFHPTSGGQPYHFTNPLGLRLGSHRTFRICLDSKAVAVWKNCGD